MGKTSKRRNSVKNEIVDEYSEDRFEQGSQIAEKLQTYVNYEGLKLTNNIHDIQIDSDEEEAYLLILPKGVHMKDLENSRFSLNKESKIKVKSEKLKLTNCLVSQKSQYFIKSGGLKKITPISTLILGNKMETESDDSFSEEGKVKSVAENLTKKHVMFGQKFEDRINLQEEIEKKIQEALRRVEKKELKMKRKKTAKVENEEREEKSLLISQILEEKLKSKKLQRAGNKLKNPNESETHNSGSSDKDNTKKKQKKNCLLENSVAQPIKTEIIFHNNFKLDSIDSMESNGIQECEQPQDILNINQESNTEKSPKKKKKHKSIANIESSNQEIGGCEEYNGQLKDTLEVDNDQSNTEKKDKKKKKKNKSNTNLDSSSQGICETEENKNEQLEERPKVNDESNTEKKAKKKNKKSITNLDSSSNGICDGEELQEDKSKIDYESNTEEKAKKKKKKKSEEINMDIEIKKELLSDVDMTDLSFSSSVHKENKREKRKHLKENEITGGLKEQNEESSNQVVTSSKKRKRNHENSSIEFNNEVLSQNEDMHVKKKKKKRRDSQFLGPENIKQEIDDSDMSIRRKSLLSSTLIKEPSPDFKPNISVIPNENSEKKKKKKSNDLIQSLLATVKQNLDNPSSPKKKLSL